MWAADPALVEGMDSFSHEVVRHRLWQVNEEQAVALRRSTGSPVVDMGDFNVSLANAAGDVVFDGSFALFHSSTTHMLFKWLLDWAPDNVGVEDGDMFFTNNPWMGPLHYNDGIVATPIFWEGRLVCWSGAVLHNIDVGGVDPGSSCVSAPDRWSDPPRMSPVKIVERGRLRRDVEQVYLANSRTPALLALDLHAQIAAGNVARARVTRLIEQYGVDTICAVMERTLRDADAALRARLRELPDGTFRSVQHVEQNAIGDDHVHQVRLALTKQGERLTFDLRGSSPQGGIIGVPLHVSKAALMVPVLEMLCSGLPRSSSAVLGVCDFVTERGTLPDVDETASISCATATGLFSQISVSRQAVCGLLGTHPEFRDLAFAPGYTSHWVTTMAGVDQAGHPFVMVPQEPGMAGVGARPYGDGVDTGGIPMVPFSQAPDVETYESTYPMLYAYRREAVDSGGAGRFRGGAGPELAYLPYGTEDELAVLTIGFGGAFPDNMGIYGGYPSSANEAGIVRETSFAEAVAHTGTDWGERFRVLPAKSAGNPMSSSDLFVVRLTASGGMGDPLEREPQAVATDVADGHVSAEAAARVYGVVIVDGRVDASATEARRAEVRAHRLAQPLASEVFATQEEE